MLPKEIYVSGDNSQNFKYTDLPEDAAEKESVAAEKQKSELPENVEPVFSKTNKSSAFGTFNRAA